MDTKEDLVRLDIHLSWAGNPDIVCQVGYKGLPLVLNLSQITFKGKAKGWKGGHGRMGWGALLVLQLQ